MKDINTSLYYKTFEYTVTKESVEAVLCECLFSVYVHINSFSDTVQYKSLINYWCLLFPFKKAYKHRKVT